MVEVSFSLFSDFNGDPTFVGTAIGYGHRSGKMNGLNRGWSEGSRLLKGLSDICQSIRENRLLEKGE